MPKVSWTVLPVLLLFAFGANAQESGRVPYIDTHAHLHGVIGQGRSDYEGAARYALQMMDDLGIRQTIVLPPPFTAGHEAAFDAETLKPIALKYPDRLRFMAGGGTLSPMLLDAAKSGESGDDLRQRFAAAAERVAASGAVAFGELALEHFGLGPGHNYEYVPPDHPLLLLLANLAAEKDMPIEVHLEAIEREAPIAERYLPFGNPAVLKPNIEAFERLLAHNPKARIVWAHMGWDNTGQRTPALMARLFAAHPNLFVNIKMGPDSLPVNRPLERGQGIAQDRSTPSHSGDSVLNVNPSLKQIDRADSRPQSKPLTGFDFGRSALVPEWGDLIKKFPDRIMLGSDQFYVTPSSSKRFPMHMRPVRDLLDALPRDIAVKVGYETAVKVYRLER